MNLKKSALVSLVSALALVASLVASSVGAQSTSSDEGTGVVVVVSAGELYVEVCNVDATIDFGSVGVSLVDGATSQADLDVCIHDTKLHRGSFGLSLVAGGWTSSNTWAGYPASPIPASALIPLTITQPFSLLMNGGYGHPNSGAIYSGNGLGGAANVFQHTDTLPVSTHPWASGDLSTARGIAHADPGRGTIKTDITLVLQLTVPANTSPGTYNAELTLDLIENAP